VTLALLLEEDGRADDAEAVLLVAAEAGDVQALTNLGTRWRDNASITPMFDRLRPSRETHRPVRGEGT
jgi:hypothetical protein